MKFGWLVLASTTAVLFALFGTEAEAGRTLRDFSGDAMQRFDSRMMASPVMRFPGLFGLSLWPYISYPSPGAGWSPPGGGARWPGGRRCELPTAGGQRPPPPTPRARPKFWTALCGVFVELEVSSTMNLMEEERKPCSR